jgi:putative endonuclease
MMEKNFFVYIMASKRYGTLYVGVTPNLPKRVYEHKEELADGFTKKYRVKQLVYFETHADAESAILREKQMKDWKREWKIELIEKSNLDWKDFYEDICR